ncbi:hypothetical protein AB1Y20_012657 [Prymnesium parvum]
MQRKTFKQLGTLTVQATQLANQRLSLSSEELLKAAEKERERLEEIGELDIVGDRQPKNPPPLDESLVGRQLDIHWRYWRILCLVKGERRSRFSCGVKAPS